MALNTFAAFGLISASIQFWSAVWAPEDGIPYPWWAVLTVVAASLAFGLVRAWPRQQVRREFGRPDIVVEVRVGDLFDQDGHLVVGFSDTFDTDIESNVIINAKSVQGQLLSRVYGGDRERLDAELKDVLTNEPVAIVEPPGAKRDGKTHRYPIGTVAVLGSPSRRIFAVAYSKMGNDLIARSSVDHLWHSLNQVWESIYLHGQRERIAIPLIGAEFARI
ncbi:MAG: macro domain-containing protein, partial [Candidatus Binatia bacterium]